MQVLIILFIFTMNSLFAQTDEPKSFEPVAQNKVLTLSDAIEQGLRINNNQIIRSYKFELANLSLKDNYDGFWFPQLSLSISSNDHFAQGLYSDDQDDYLAKSPNGSLQLGFEEYTLFNWGKDYLVYLNNKAQLKQEQQKMTAQRRNLKLDIITMYFYVASTKNISIILKEQLRQTSFLYKLAKEKREVRKITTQELLQVKSEFLRAHEEYQAAQYEVAKASEELAQLISDDIPGGYNIVDTLKFKKISLRTTEALQIAVKTNQDVLNRTQELQNAQRSYELSLKENLPLPKLSLRLGAFRHSFDSQGAKNTFYTNEDSFGGSSKNIELAASVNMSWKIFGSSGFFNQRDRKSAYLQQKIAQVQLNEAHRKAKSLIRRYSASLRALERQVEALEVQLKTNKKTFDITLDRYISGKTKFPNIKLTLDSFINNQTRLIQSKFEHLEQKINMAKTLGREDFPGENFEDLVIR